MNFNRLIDVWTISWDKSRCSVSLLYLFSRFEEVFVIGQFREDSIASLFPLFVRCVAALWVLVYYPRFLCYLKGSLSWSLAIVLFFFRWNMFSLSLRNWSGRLLLRRQFDGRFSLCSLDCGLEFQRRFDKGNVHL
jgi:hypothetical protein